MKKTVFNIIIIAVFACMVVESPYLIFSPHSLWAMDDASDNSDFNFSFGDDMDGTVSDEGDDSSISVDETDIINETDIIADDETSPEGTQDTLHKVSALRQDAIKFPSNGKTAGEEAAVTLHGVTYRFRWCPSGAFQMGSPLTEIGRKVDEKPMEATIPHGFWILETEVTMQMFASFVHQTEYKTVAERDGIGGYRVNLENGQTVGPDPTANWRNIGYQQEKSFPVTNVTWYDAQEFVKWFQKELSTHEDPVDSRRQVRLPSEMQWEYACRAGKTTRFGCGDDLWELAEHANLRDIRQNAKLMGSDEWKRSPWTLPLGGPFKYTGRVGSFTPNSWGIFDMHGNVWEWCNDGYADYENVTIPSENASNLEKFLGRMTPDTHEIKAMRGGSWNTAYLIARCAKRGSNPPSRRHVTLGFRFIVLPMEAETSDDGFDEDGENDESATDSIFGNSSNENNDENSDDTDDADDSNFSTDDNDFLLDDEEFEEDGSEGGAEFGADDANDNGDDDMELF